jgi:hypothetical protein
VRAAAAPLGTDDLPEDWKDAPLVMLAPVLAEVDPLLSVSFPDAAVSAQAQGWLRVVEPDGAVGSLAWEPGYLLARLQTLFLSQRDVLGQEAAMLEWLQRVPVGVVTAGRHGALLYVNGERYEVRPRAAREVDATGAGDVFAATFLVRYQEDGNPWTAAEAAACAAALSIEGEGWSAVPDAAALERALDDHPRLRLMVCHVGGAPEGIWQRRALLAKKANGWVDLAALPLLGGRDEEYPFPLAQEVVRWAVETFGAERVLWGTDYPPTLNGATYRQLLDWVRRHCPFLSEAQRAEVLGGAAERVLRELGG